MLQAPTVTLTRHCAHQSELTTGQHSHLEQRIDGWSEDTGGCGGPWGKCLLAALKTQPGSPWPAPPRVTMNVRPTA